jgi:hypothetical protein
MGEKEICAPAWKASAGKPAPAGIFDFGFSILDFRFPIRAARLAKEAESEARRRKDAKDLGEQ